MKCKRCNKTFEEDWYGYVRDNELICGRCDIEAYKKSKKIKEK